MSQWNINLLNDRLLVTRLAGHLAVLAVAVILSVHYLVGVLPSEGSREQRAITWVSLQLQVHLICTLALERL